MTRSEIFFLASIIKTERGYFCTRSEAMKLAWLCAKGFTACFDLSLSTGRVTGGAHSVDEARAKWIAAERKAVRSGVKSYGSQEFSLTRYMWLAKNAPAHPVKAAVKTRRRPALLAEIPNQVTA